MMYLNPSPSTEPMSAGADRGDVMAEFAKRVQHRMIMKGWNQSDLARQASVHLAEKGGKRKSMGRDSVSHYIRGKNMPTPSHLHALAKALGCEPFDLMPSIGMPSVEDRKKPAMRVDTLESGRAHIVMDRVVSLATALKIQQAIMEDDAT